MELLVEALARTAVLVTRPRLAVPKPAMRLVFLTAVERKTVAALRWMLRSNARRRSWRSQASMVTPKLAAAGLRWV